MDKDIYNLQLHEVLDIKDFLIKRVASGWIYIFKQKNNYGQLIISPPVFVPFDNSFQAKK